MPVYTFGRPAGSVESAVDGGRTSLAAAFGRAALSETVAGKGAHERSAARKPPASAADPPQRLFRAFRDRIHGSSVSERLPRRGRAGKSGSPAEISCQVP